MILSFRHLGYFLKESPSGILNNPGYTLLPVFTYYVWQKKYFVLGVIYILRSQRGREQASKFMVRQAIHNKALELSKRVLFLQTWLLVNSAPSVTELEKILEVS